MLKLIQLDLLERIRTDKDENGLFDPGSNLSRTACSVQVLFEGRIFAGAAGRTIAVARNFFAKIT